MVRAENWMDFFFSGRCTHTCCPSARSAEYFCSSATVRNGNAPFAIEIHASA